MRLAEKYDVTMALMRLWVSRATAGSSSVTAMSSRGWLR
jgi:hypothetical protein